jgi:death-on-curing protein
LSEVSFFDYLREDDLVEIAEAVIEDEVVISDPGLLVAALDRPWMRVLGRDVYPELADQAAALMQSLARNGPLASGNEALAWTATRVFCLLNGRDWSFDIDEAKRTLLALAGREMDAGGLAAVLRERI